MALTCQSCGAEGSGRSLVLNLAGHQRELSLCPECAERVGINPPDSAIPLRVADLWADVWQPELASGQDGKICPDCRTSFRTIRRTGRVGCMRCYAHFRQEIAALLPRLSSRPRHTGRLPTRLEAYRLLFQGAVHPGGLEANQEPGDDVEAIVSGSQFVLVRNAMDFPFPPRLARLEAMRLLAALERFFRNQSPASRSDQLQNQPIGIIRHFRIDPNLECRVNQDDHFRLEYRSAGFPVEQAFQKLHELETSLEQAFPFAVNLEWGHLGSSLATLGTGLHITVNLHLAALERALGSPACLRLLETEPVFQGLTMQVGERDGLFTLMNRETLGLSERYIADKLARSITLLLHYEQDAIGRQRRVQGMEFDDQIWRTWGKLGCARLLSDQELFESLCGLRQASLLADQKLPPISIALLQKVQAMLDSPLDDSSRAKDVRQLMFEESRRYGR